MTKTTLSLFTDNLNIFDFAVFIYIDFNVPRLLVIGYLNLLLPDTRLCRIFIIRSENIASYFSEYSF